MMDHPQLIVQRSTTSADIANFINDASSKDNSGGKWHLRACERTYKTQDGKLCTVKVLFIRSGRKDPVEWFKSMWNRARQYKLARSVLAEVAKPSAGAPVCTVDFRKHDIDYGSALRVALDSNADKSLTLASLATAVENARPRYRPYMHFEPSDRIKLADFFNVQSGSREEFEENFMDFSRLARLLSKSGHPAEEHPALIKQSKRLSSLLLGAAKFSQFWQQNRNYHDGICNSAIIQIDQFATWLTETYLLDQKDARSSPPVFRISD
jgi:hypothetical protein